MPHLRRLCENVETVDRGRAVGRSQYGADDSQRRGLARAVGPQQAVDFAGESVETKSPQNGKLSVFEVSLFFG